MKLTLLVSALACSASAFQVGPPPQKVRGGVATPTSTELGVSMIPNDFLKEQNGGKQRYTKPVAKHSVNPVERVLMKNVVIPPSYNLALAMAPVGPLIAYAFSLAEPSGYPSMLGIFGAGFHILFAAILYVQTARVRCVFENDAFEFYNVKGPGLDYEGGKAKLVKKPANFHNATPNRWKYDKITNYGFYPSEEFPVICYMKEVQTPEELWDKKFAAFDSYGHGQPHFFPGIFSVKKFKEQMEKRGVKSKAIPTPNASKKR